MPVHAPARAQAAPTHVVWWSGEKHDGGLERDLMVPVRNGPRGVTLKPETGGLWTSPADSEWGWEHWCRSEQMQWLKDRYVLTVEPDVRLLLIDSEADLMGLWHHYHLPDVIVGPYRYRVLDFEAMAAEWDGLWLTEHGFHRTRWVGLGSDLWMVGTSGWDCETILWFRWAFTEVTK